MWFQKKTNKPFAPKRIQSYTVKAIAPADWQNFRAFYLRMVKEHPTRCADSYDEMKSLPPQYWQQLIERATIDPSSLLIGVISETSGAYVGVVHMQGRSEYKRSHESEVRMYVFADDNGDDVLQEQVWSMILDYLDHESDVDKVVVGVQGTDRQAMRLYNALGFERYGYDGRYYRVGKRYINAVLMVKYL